MTCFDECIKLKEKFPGWYIKKVFNKNDPYTRYLGYYVQHVKGNFIVHYIIQNGEIIIDPFLMEVGPIKLKEYLSKYYHNSNELSIV